MTSREAAKRAVRLHTAVIPVTRLAGFAVVSALIPLHNAAVFGDPAWRSMGAFALVASVYSLGSWLVLRTFFARSQAIPWGDVFLVADIVVLLYAIHLTGGPGSWLFLLLAGRCVDQSAEGFRRTVWFNHLIVGLYAAYLFLVVHPAAHPGDIPWTLYAAKLSLLYAFNWYCSLMARTVDSVRARARRTELAKRTEAEIAGAVAHSIRTSVDGMEALTDLLFETPLDARQQRYVTGLVEYGRDVLNKVPLLHASSVEADSLAIQQAQLAPGRLIEELASLLRPLAESKGLDLRVELGSEVPLSMIGDCARIRQVLLSLTHNAIRFTEHGFVELRCWWLWPGHVAFQVRDSGPGIPANVQRRISAGFARADGTVWHRYHGTQIGLSVSHRLIELMGGRLIVESDPWHGSTVRMELPLHGTRSFFVAPPSPLSIAVAPEPAPSTLARSLPELQ